MKKFLFISINILNGLLFSQNADTLPELSERIETIRYMPSNTSARAKLFFNFSDLTSKDTLKIWSNIMDCGEFGGHNEYIFIYQNKDKTFAKLKRDKFCDPKSEINKPKGKFKKSIELSSEFKSSISNYVNKFNDFKATSGLFSNAPTDFWIKYKEEVYHFNDPSGRWKEFLILRDELFLR